MFSFTNVRCWLWVFISDGFLGFAGEEKRCFGVSGVVGRRCPARNFQFLAQICLPYCSYYSPVVSEIRRRPGVPAKSWPTVMPRDFVGWDRGIPWLTVGTATRTSRARENFSPETSSLSPRWKGSGGRFSSWKPTLLRGSISG